MGFDSSGEYESANVLVAPMDQDQLAAALQAAKPILKYEVARAMRKFAVLRPDPNDLEQMGWLILIRAFSHWDPDGKAKWVTYVGRALQWLGHAWRKSNRRWLDQVVYLADFEMENGEEFQLADPRSWQPMLRVSFVPTDPKLKAAYWKRFRRNRLRIMRAK